MEILETGGINLLSTDLNGYEKYLEEQGFSNRHIGFLKLAPRLLFKLFGAYSSLELLKYNSYRSKFLDTIKQDYCRGTLKKYASGITHYRNYLIAEKIISVSPRHERANNNKSDLERCYYQENKTAYYKEVETNFLNHLTIEMKYCKSEIRKRTATYQRFASYLLKNQFHSLTDVKGQNVLEFGSLETTFQTDWNKLRSFLSFAYREGYILENFAGAIIPNKKNRHRRKKYLSRQEIEKILASLPCLTLRDVRTYAMFLLMARLGFRPSETVRVRLADIDWVNSKILVRGKSNRLDWLPVPIDVAEAVIKYLKVSERGCSGFLFVQERPPYNAISHTYSLTLALRKVYERTGINPPSGDVRLNVFRHSFATSLINNKGQNFFTAQIFLRHSSPEMTLNYAKYHAPKLRLFEQTWPEGRR